MPKLIFQAALGPAIDATSPGVREHFLQPPGVRHYRGVMRKVWRRDGARGLLAALFLRAGSLTGTLFSDTGEDVGFLLENEVTLLDDGWTRMRWSRTFYFPQGIRKFDAVMRFDEARNVIVDHFGKRGRMEVDLHPRVEQGAMVIESGRQIVRLGWLRVPMPRLFSAQARIREWEEGDGKFRISVTLHNPLLGDFFGYEGSFARAADGD
jgi:hypothetical protein